MPKEIKKRRQGFGTTAVHGGEDCGLAFNPASTPIFQTSTFLFESTEEAGDVQGGGGNEKYR